MFISQFRKVADGFDRALNALKAGGQGSGSSTEIQALQSEMGVAEAAALHFRSTANQARFTSLRRAVARMKVARQAEPALAEIEHLLNEEVILARRLYTIQSSDSRIGFEASNQYYYVPIDLMEKVLNCVDLRDRWLSAQRARFGL